MNYRHIYHAGNFADVFKHSILVLMIKYLYNKEKPFFLLDTHAAIGGYDLASVEAQKTGEFRDGIVRLLKEEQVPAELKDYVYIVKAFNSEWDGEEGGLTYYPGSPRIMRSLLRENDRLFAVELHPEDAESLAAEFHRDRQVKVFHQDGYNALKSFLPPLEHRGLVLVDPPFEVKGELDKLVKSIQQAYKRWATGTYAIWYPIKDRIMLEAFYVDIVATGIRRVLLVELLIHDENDALRLNGCGFIIINPPWVLYDQLQQLLPFLHNILSVEGKGKWKLEWLVTE